MMIHPKARTTPQIRVEIKALTGVSQAALAEKYNVSRQTIIKWQNREETTDKSHRPDHRQTTLSTVQEDIVAERRYIVAWMLSTKENSALSISAHGFHGCFYCIPFIILTLD